MKRRNTLKDLGDSALEAALQAALYRRDCPTTMELGDYELGLLAEDQRTRIHSHVQRCPHCRTELNRLSSLLSDRAMPVMMPELTPAPDPSWRQIMLDYGRAWLDQQTGRWRQLWLSLSSLGTSAAGAPVLAGLMSAAEKVSGTVPGALFIANPDADFEIRLTVVPEPTPTNPNLCRLEVSLSLKERFGDFSGVEVALFRDRSAERQVTNAQGEVTFSGLLSDQIATMSLIVILPD